MFFSLSLLYCCVQAHHFHTYQTGFRLAPTLSLCLLVSTRPIFSPRVLQCILYWFGIDNRSDVVMCFHPPNIFTSCFVVLSFRFGKKRVSREISIQGEGYYTTCAVKNQLQNWLLVDGKIFFALGKQPIPQLVDPVQRFPWSESESE